VTAHGIYDWGARTIIQNNIISAITGPALEIVTQVEMTQADGPKVISNNTIFNNGGGINLSELPTGATSLTSTKVDYYTISNNVIVNNGVDAPQGGSFGIAYYHVTGTHNVVNNNLIYGNKPADYSHGLSSCTGGTPISGTDAGGTAGGCPSTNPRSDVNTGVTFINFQLDTPTSPASNYNPDNYQIKDGSNAIRGGIPNCAAAPGVSPCVPITDVVGVLRPASNPTIGAFEQGGGPAAPTGLTASVQ
jgi:hypothetical protein